MIVLLSGLVLITLTLFTVALRSDSDRLLSEGMVSLEKAEKLNGETKRLLEEGCK